ncbi:hypothetical protein yc1106_10159 [Curvularia clavata]|uniref:Uncharacterized protein n=1 Tax=Curvularia clavata TaxID=95742 RepID=A0A9Q9DYE5_CURCL|nr:hypothetical protein yc1106_10159 [Curvularia clavata]
MPLAIIAVFFTAVKAVCFVTMLLRFDKKTVDQPIMNIVVITALLGTAPHLAYGIAVLSTKPAVKITELTKTVPFTTVDLVSKRADDEWLMVIYNNGSEGDQCGGVANDFSGKSSLCQRLDGVTGKVCADVKVQANVGFAKCDFSFRSDGTSCGGAERQKVTANKGEDSDGVKLFDDVKFVAINCS